MKKIAKSLILILSSLVVGAGAGYGASYIVRPPEEPKKPIEIDMDIENYVSEITLSHNGSKVTTGLITLDISQTSTQVVPNIKTIGNPTYTVSYSIDDPSVATVSSDGTITVVGVGEAVLTVTAGDQTTQIVIAVENQYAIPPQSYSVTVVGGTASLESAKEGQHVALKVDNASLDELHQEFTGWQYKNLDTGLVVSEEDLWINGSIFKMPSFNIEIIAITKAKLYSLNLVDATIKTCTTTEGAYTPVSTFDEESQATVYSLPYNAEVTIVANEEAKGKMFAGFDVGSKNNRIGDLGVKEYSFNMPAETHSIFAMFADIRDLKFGDVNGLTGSGVAIVNGKPSGAEVADPDLKGYNGYTFTFNSTGSATAADSFPSGGLTSCVDFSTLKHGSQTVRMVYKNHSDQAFAVEMYAEQYATVVGSGVIQIPAHGLVEEHFILKSGFHNPSFGLVLREGCHGGSDSSIKLDVGLAVGDTYPAGDPQFVVPEAEYVVLKKLTTGADFPAGSGIRGDCFQCGPSAASTAGAPTSGSFGGRKNTNNNNGITNFVLRDSYITFSPTPYIYAQIDNLPDYYGHETITVYFRVTNTNANSCRYIFGLGSSTNVTGDTTRVYNDLTVEGNKSYIFGITFTRPSADAKVYVSIVKPAKTGLDGNFIMQMMFNNKIGCKDENIYSADAE